MPKQNLITLLHSIEVENLYKKLIEQLNKDFRLSNLEAQFNLTIAPNELLIALKRILERLITNKYDDYLNFLYRIDVSEKELLTIKSGKLEEIIDELTYLILKREYQKVWFKNKL
jgi:DNA-binding Lrp family transcriptional regulator